MITLATLPQATAQEVFDQVKNHLLTQNRKSYGGFGSCVYRGENGTKCAAGCLISDEEYRKEFENQTWYTLCMEGRVPIQHQSLISDLQDIHDHFITREWPSELKKLAETDNLNYEN